MQATPPKLKNEFPFRHDLGVFVGTKQNPAGGASEIEGGSVRQHDKEKKGKKKRVLFFFCCSITIENHRKSYLLCLGDFGREFSCEETLPTR